jgi:hypothetical protein
MDFLTEGFWKRGRLLGHALVRFWGDEEVEEAAFLGISGGEDGGGGVLISREEIEGIEAVAPALLSGAVAGLAVFEKDGCDLVPEADGASLGGVRKQMRRREEKQDGEAGVH